MKSRSGTNDCKYDIAFSAKSIMLKTFLFSFYILSLLFFLEGTNTVAVDLIVKHISNQLEKVSLKST